MFLETAIFLLISSTTMGEAENVNDIQQKIQERSIAIQQNEGVVSPPKFKEKPTWPQSPYYDEFGPAISLSCDLVQTDGTTLLWFKDQTLLEPSSQFVIKEKNQTLTLEYPRQNQTGHYECLAFNSEGFINYTGYIFISARSQDTRPRVVLTDPTNLVKHASIGDNVTISCTFDVGGSTSGLFDFNMKWGKGNQTVSDTNHTTWGVNETKSNNQILSLTIHSFTASDYGSYQCIGQNQKGNDSRIVYVVPPEKLKGKLPVAVIIAASCSAVVIILMLGVTARFYHRYRLNRKYERLEWGEPDVEKYDVPKRKLKFDVFVSYSHEDLLWVKDKLFKNLSDRRYEVCLDFKDFVPGMATSENILDAIYTSRKTIVLMSKHFLKSMWGQFEMQQAHYKAISQRKDVLILVKFDHCKVPAKLMGKTFLDWSDSKVRPHFWDRLFEALGEPGNFNPDEQLLRDVIPEPGEGHVIKETNENPEQDLIEEPGDFIPDEQLLRDQRLEPDKDHIAKETNENPEQDLLGEPGDLNPDEQLLRNTRLEPDKSHVKRETNENPEQELAWEQGNYNANEQLLRDFCQELDKDHVIREKIENSDLHFQLFTQ